MFRFFRPLLLILLVPTVALGQNATTDASGDLADALSASYGSHAAGATVVDWEGNVLQEGNNGYTCMPTPPAFKERGVTSPMCLDEVWLAWADAWSNRKPFSTDRVGIAYMLSGDGGASNIDPFAEGPTDDNEWIEEGAHLMIISPSSELLAGIPTDPSYGGPYVMWRGTDYEHVMVPVKVGESGQASSQLEEALSASDTNMRKSVAVMDWEGNTLRESDSGYACFPTPPQVTSGSAPMCFDEPWMGWGDAWVNKKPYSTDKIGIAYMLAGDAGASNVDPYAEGPSEDNEWVQEGPHIMLVAPDAAMLSGMTRDPEVGGPYVMWDGTPYVHVMIPIADRP